jgi:predicted Zn-dependent peptidase
MHVGSVDEHAHEQGIAHFVEHITFLGSHKRETVGSLGGRSNAYTDFQHTIFHVDCPTHDAMSKTPLVGVVIDMLAEVAFGAEFLRSRIEKERKAVLAEAQMMNTIEYRMDCQLLKYLHEENNLGHRFPIGMVDQARPLAACAVVLMY